MGTQEKPAGTAMGRRPQSIGEEFGGVSIRDDPELGTYFLKPPKCHIAIYRFSYWRRDPVRRRIVVFEFERFKLGLSIAAGRREPVATGCHE